MSVTIKVFYEKSNGGPEIRRFPLNSTNGDDCFLQTRDRIKTLYPTLVDVDFQLFWKDSDGDRIAFSSAEEMKDALNYVTDGVFRVYIPATSKLNLNEFSIACKTPEVKTVPKPKEPKGASTCDKGQNQAKADGHQQQQSSQKSSDGQPKAGSEGPFHPNVVCDGCEGPVKGIRFKCCVCPDYDLCSPCEGKGLHTQHEMYKIPEPKRRPHFGFVPPPFAGNIHQGFVPPQFGANIHQEAHKAAHAAATAAAASFGCGGGAGSGCHSQGTEGKQKNYDSYLKNVGANIAAFLDPFGIDVTYDVHHNNSGPGQHWHWAGGNNAGQGCPAWEGMERRPASSSTSTSTSTSSTTTSNKKDASPTAGKDGGKADSMETDCFSGQEAPMEHDSKNGGTPRPGSEDWTIVPDDGSEVSVPDPDTAIPMPAPPVRETAPQVNTDNSTTPQNSNGIYPNLRVQQSLEQMMSMGFTNADNWLSDLLVDNNCDIGQTLDAIKSKATQQLDSLRK